VASPKSPSETRQRLGYCTNVHPYADLDGMLEALEHCAAPVRERLVASGRLAAGDPLGVGLWFPAPVATAVARDPSRLAETLERLSLDAFTVNAFPHGVFHGDAVKDAVFRPAWGDPERLRFTLEAARALAALLPEGATGSLSTHTGAYKGWGPPLATAEPIAGGLTAAAEGLRQLEDETGRRILLALEPEPLSFLETTDEVIAFFGTHLHPTGEAARRYLGLCYDACHQAVEFEDMAASIAALRAADIPIAKVQLSSAIRVPAPRAAHDLLQTLAEDRWFHQVVTRDGVGALRRIADLPLALTDDAAAAAAEWRVHYHVPIFADRLDDAGRLLTTRPQLEELIRLLGASDAPLHAEIETYTWHAIPQARREELGVTSLTDCLEREFSWAMDRLKESTRERRT
jgi:sugar phosphate isomerase/epimerase